MMPRQHSPENSRNSGTNNNSMNVNTNVNMNHNAGAGGERGSSSRSKSSGGSNMLVNDQIRQRYSHHGGGPIGGDPSGGGAGASAAAVAAAGGASAAAEAAAAMGMSGMGDYQGFSNYQLSQSGRAAALGSFGHTPNAALAAGAGMHPAAMNPALYAAHMGSAAAAAGLQHQSPQQPSMGDHLMMGDYQRGAAAGGAGGSGGATAAATNQASMAGGSQAEHEEDLLLNLLIARRQRATMRPDTQQLGPHAGGNGGGGQSTSWVDDFKRLTQDQLGAGDASAYDGLPMSMPMHGGDTSHRSAHANARMGGMGGMGQFPNVNVNNMNMSDAAAAAANQQFLSDSSRMRQRAGSGVALQMGPPQGSWMGGNAAAAAAAMQHSHQQNAPRNESSYTQRPDMNTQLGLDVLERADRMMPTSMMHDARMAEQGNMGQHQFHQYSMGRHQGQMHDAPSSSHGYGGKRSENQGLKGSDKLSSKTEEAQPAKKKRLHKKKPADMPRRPLSAYNLFFSEERERILKEIEAKAAEDEPAGGGSGKSKEAEEEEGKPRALRRPLLPSEKKRRPHRKTHGKISFQLLAQKVGQRWKALPDDERKYYQDLAQEDMKRQKKAMEEYYQKRSTLTAGTTGSESKLVE